MLQLLLTVDYIHKMNIAHRDIKPDNILLMDRNSMEIQLADFGLACHLNDAASNKLKAGTPGFIAPEILRGENYGVKCDVFSMGCVFFMIIFRKNLYQATNIK